MGKLRCATHAPNHQQAYKTVAIAPEPVGVGQAKEVWDGDG